MSNLSKYIEKVKEYKNQNPGISEEKIIRYVYLDLGQKFSFNLKFFFTNRRTKKKIYANSESEENLNEAMESNIVICKSAAYILEYILKNVGVNIITVVDPKDKRKCPHMYNIVIPKEGEEYIIDLQEDMENIQSHYFTKNFGVSIKDGKTSVIKRANIEQMDRELGFIDAENYYADEYLYLLKSDMGYFTDFAERVQFVLENIDIYENRDIKYQERKWHHDKILKQLFSKEELKKIHIIDCYEGEGDEKEFRNCIAVERSRGTDIYMYSVEENRYCKMTIQEFAEATLNGLVNMQGILRLRKAKREIKHKKDEGR